MHPGAWVAWAGLVMVLALTITNPLYLALILLAVLLVAALSPRNDTATASFRALLAGGVAIAVISIGIATINGGYGEHTLFTVPGPDLPSWLGGLRLGGPVTLEALVAAATRGLAILCVFLAFAVLNGAVSPASMLRLGPAAVFHAGLVVTVGLALLPATIDDLRRLREIRALRGGSNGPRALMSLVVPAVLGGLERATRLAEAMEARGYAAPSPIPVRVRAAGVASVPLALAASWAWLYGGEWRTFAALPAFLAAAALGIWWMATSRARRTTRFRDEPFAPAAKAGAWLSLAVAVAAVAARSTGAFDLMYNPFANLPIPGFHPAGVALVMAALWPALPLLFAPPVRDPGAAATTSPGLESP